MFVKNLIDQIEAKSNPSVLGLDPDISYVPEHIKVVAFSEHGKTLEAAAASVLEFNRQLIDGLSDIFPAVKIQLAYYEQYGIPGMRAFEETLSYAKKTGMLIIADGKRNDIASTAKAYSNAFLGRTEIEKSILVPVYDCDALTINPYLGDDGIKPFMDDCQEYGKGIFALIKTSNPSSFQLQDVIVKDGRKVYEVVIDMINVLASKQEQYKGYSSIGAVVGANYPLQAKEIRKFMPNSYFLVPGYGAQGGDGNSVAACFNEDGLGAIVNASRSIMLAYKSEKFRNKYTAKQFVEAARDEAIHMRAEINTAIKLKEDK